LTQRVTGWREKMRNVEVRKKAGQRTEYEHECPCTVADEEVDDGGAAPAVAESNEEFEESEDKEDGLE